MYFIRFGKFFCHYFFFLIIFLPLSTPSVTLIICMLLCLMVYEKSLRRCPVFFSPFFFLSLPQTGWSQLISLSSWIFSSPADVCEVNFFLENFSFQLFYFKISIWFNFIIAIYIILTLMRYCFTLPFSSLDIVYVTEYI